MDSKIRMTRILFYISIGLGIAVLLISLMLGDSKDPRFFWGALAAIPCWGFGFYLYGRWAHLKRVKEIKARWGKEDKRKRDFQSISHYYRRAFPGTMVDDTTWNDLNMDALFAKLDRTLTGPGESVLYALLRTPCTPEQKPELQRRDQVINLFQADPRHRENLQLALSKLGKDDSNNLAHLLWDPLPSKSALAFIYPLLAVAALLASVSPFFLGFRGIFLIMLAFSVNTTVHYKATAGFSHHIPAITSLAKMLRTAQLISRGEYGDLQPEQKELKEAANSAAKILRKTRHLSLDPIYNSDFLFFLQYIKILFLLEVRSFYGTVDEIRRQLTKLREVYRIIGHLDAMQSIASYREGLTYTTPVFTAETSLKVQGLRHPLLENPVPNSISIQDQGILITGSNMAGKSTFLRTLGISVILAQSIYTCLADAYTASFLQVASSINKADDISQQKSLYYAEAERLLHIISPDYHKLPALYTIDELLSGTNYTERLSASAAILSYLKTKNALVVVATHDLDLAESLGGSYQCYHFSDKVDKNNLDFDYTLKKGIATSRNAIKLLEHLGYPQEIIQGANNSYSNKKQA